MSTFESEGMGWVHGTAVKGITWDAHILYPSAWVQVPAGFWFQFPANMYLLETDNGSGSQVPAI